MIVNTKQIVDKFSETESLEEMQNRVQKGLWDYEMNIASKYFPKSSKILVVGCGCGREAIALAKLGYEIYAMDMVSEQLEKARSNTKNEKLKITLELTDGISIPFNHIQFDIIVLWTQVLGNIESNDDRIEILQSCISRLKKNGIISATIHEKNYCKKTWTNTDGDWLYPWGEGQLRYKLFTQESFKNLLNSVNLDVIEMEVPTDQNAIIYSISKI